MLDAARVRRRLSDFDLGLLFTEELGWDRERTRALDVTVDGRAFRLEPIAQKRGMVAYRCGEIPDYATRRKIEREVVKAAFEHIVIFADEREQVWQWVKREPGRPIASREHTYRRGQPGDSLIQKLDHIAFTMDEEERLSGVSEVAGRARAGFDVERVTKRFYDRFKDEHAAFMKFVKGIPDERLQRWYVSVMLNRLMFIYFIQKKGFLDDDPDYLRRRLAASKAAGRDRFYADFLCPLFFEGFARREGERSPGMDARLGRVPYLDGGLFEKHQIEEAHGAQITIPDAAFEALFAFFDAYQWHLDERPVRDDNEINPDVLGYIFEKYINQKQMGAYYTKEDITGYISQNTVIPFLFDAAEKECKIAFEAADTERINGLDPRVEESASSDADGATDTKRKSRRSLTGGGLWGLLAADPDRYIYPAVRHGVTWDIRTNQALAAPLALPDDIAAGVNPPTLHDVVGEGPVGTLEARKGWNRAAPPESALPTEIWREVVARRQRYEEVRGKLAAGEVHDINDLITYNLDIRQFAQDVIRNCEAPELLRAFWKAVRGMTVLDPTVGSGAFLFAALNVLEPLYEACLERMQAFVDDLDRSSPLLAGGGPGGRSAKFSDFRAALAEVERHPNRRYFILKSIIVNNLYGVDIMDEAVEICKLRLFLKLAAQVKEVEKLEPLPDIDFNVRAGNTLVGYVKREDVKRALTAQGEQDRLMFPDEQDAMARIEEKIAAVDAAAALFRQQQTALGGQVSAEDKAALKGRLKELADELDAALAREYGVEPKWKEKYDAWRASHQPFHWFAEFHTILARGGFDVVIGNPPYVEYSKIQNQYRVTSALMPYTTNLYSICCYRAQTLKHSHGYASFIVPVSLPSTDRMQALRDALLHGHSIHFVSFSTRPSKLFDGAEQRLTIYIASPGKPAELFTGGYHKWSAEERETLFDTLDYSAAHPLAERYHIWPKVRGNTHLEVLQSIRHHHRLSATEMLGAGSSLYYKNTGLRYFNTVTLRPPKCWIDGVATSSSRETVLDVRIPFRHAVHALLLSSTFFVHWETLTNCRDLNPADIGLFPVPSLQPNNAVLGALSNAAEEDYSAKAKILKMHNKLTGLVEIESMTSAESKPIIDEIDTVLARHYGFTEEELDFIINYDIKYRMGGAAGEE